MAEKRPREQDGTDDEAPLLIRSEPPVNKKRKHAKLMAKLNLRKDKERTGLFLKAPQPQGAALDSPGSGGKGKGKGKGKGMGGKGEGKGKKKKSGTSLKAIKKGAHKAAKRKY